MPYCYWFMNSEMSIMQSKEGKRNKKYFCANEKWVMNIKCELYIECLMQFKINAFFLIFILFYFYFFVCVISYHVVLINWFIFFSISFDHSRSEMKKEKNILSEFSRLMVILKSFRKPHKYLLHIIRFK